MIYPRENWGTEEYQVKPERIEKKVKGFLRRRIDE